MSKFNYYTGIAENGNLCTEYVEAGSIKLAKQHLRNKGLAEGFVATCDEVKEEYKGFEIIESESGMITAYDKTRHTRFVVALDDSKRSGKRVFNDDCNNTTEAKKYIDWVTEIRSK